MKCILCEKEISGKGHNAFPLSDEGVCCEACNYGLVIPARIQMLMTMKSEEEEEKPPVKGKRFFVPISVNIKGRVAVDADNAEDAFEWAENHINELDIEDEDQLLQAEIKVDRQEKYMTDDGKTHLLRRKKKKGE